MDNRNSQEFRQYRGQQQRQPYQQYQRGPQPQYSRPYRPNPNIKPENHYEPEYDEDFEDYEDEDKKKSFWVTLIRWVLVLVSIALIGYCAINLYEMWNKTSLPSNIQHELIDTDDDGKRYLRLNWDALQETYPEIVGWIYVPHTDINYPIVQHSGSETKYYLTHGGQMEPNEMGAIFLENDADSEFKADNTVIYGHSIMYMGGMFTGLNRFLEDSHFEDVPYLYILTPEATYRGEIRDFGRTKDGSNFYVRDTNKWKDQTMAQWQLDNAMHKRDSVKLEEGSNLVTLSTCDLSQGGEYTETRFVLQAKLRYYMEDVEYVDDTNQEAWKKMMNFFDESITSLDTGKSEDKKDEAGKEN